jgi:hypothetical protein
MKQTRALTWDYVCELETRRTDLLSTSARLRNERNDLRAALHIAADMLDAVAGDLEDGGSLDTLRGKYGIALVNARDDARAAIAKATT